MPGNLSAADPTGVLPLSLSKSFQEAQIFPMMAVPYHDGVTERALVVDGVNAPQPLRTWKLAKRLTPAALATLLSFFEGQNGGLAPFYFYDPFDVDPGTAIGSNYDATGLSAQGRHTVVFRGDWSHAADIARAEAPIELVEIA